MHQQLTPSCVCACTHVCADACEWCRRTSAAAMAGAAAASCDGVTASNPASAGSGDKNAYIVMVYVVMAYIVMACGERNAFDARAHRPVIIANML